MSMRGAFILWSKEYGGYGNEEAAFEAGWYAAQQQAETPVTSTNNRRSAICPNCKNEVSIRNLEILCQCPHCKVDYPFVIRGKQHPVR